MAKRQKYKKPNWFVYAILKFISRIIAKNKFKIKILNNELKGVKGPYVVLANHEASTDFLNLAYTLKRRVHFVISNAFYQTLGIKWLLDSVGVIPKQQFQTTISDMKKMKTVIDNNMPLVIYPAGLMTESGITTPIPQGTGKCIKWLNADVYVAYTEGSYLTNPKWSTKKRKGQITLDIKKLYSKEDLLNINPDLVQKQIDDILYYDSYQNQKQNMVKYKNGDNVVGLDNVLYECPKCHSEFTIIAQNTNELVCTKCNNTVVANNYSLLAPKTSDDVAFKLPSDWARMIQTNLKNTIDNNPSFELLDECEIHMINNKKHKFLPVGNGVIKLTSEGFTLSGTINNQEINTFFNIINYPSLPLKPGKCFDIQKNMNIYRIYPKNNKSVTKWINTLHIFHQKKISGC